MACLAPINIKTKMYRTPVPCGRCVGCLNSRRASWTFRILEEEKRAKSSTFLTLTYDNENLPIIDQNGEFVTGVDLSCAVDRFSAFSPTLYKKHLQDYFKRVRKISNGLKYYAVGEYGEKNGRPHYHAIVFNANEDVLKEKWDKGLTQCDKVTQASIHYVTKYIMKPSKHQKESVCGQFALMSKGMGSNYAEYAGEYHRKLKTDVVTYVGGFKQKMPRYLKQKIFDESTQRMIGMRNLEVMREKSDQETIEEQINREKYIIAKSKKVNKSNKV